MTDTEKLPLGKRAPAWLPPMEDGAAPEHLWFNAFNDESNYYEGTFVSDVIKHDDKPYKSYSSAMVWYVDEDGDKQWTTVPETDFHLTKVLALKALQKVAMDGVKRQLEDVKRARAWVRSIQAQIMKENTK